MVFSGRGPPSAAGMSPRSTAESSAFTSSCDRILSTKRPLLDHELGEVDAAHLFEPQFLVDPPEQRLLEIEAPLLGAQHLHGGGAEDRDDEIEDLRLVLLELLRLPRISDPDL